MQLVAQSFIQFNRNLKSDEVSYKILHSNYIPPFRTPKAWCLVTKNIITPVSTDYLHDWQNQSRITRYDYQEFPVHCAVLPHAHLGKILLNPIQKMRFIHMWPSVINNDAQKCYWKVNIIPTEFHNTFLSANQLWWQSG